jgi:lipopolysaccharide/colanic/teichoic acid biosynthesis glycosyltransferase
MIRGFDLFLSLGGLIFSAPLLMLLWLLSLLDTGAPLFKQERIGRNGKPFTLVKFRTMQPNTISVPTHLVDVSAVTKLGYFLRRTKFDELPQLWNVLKGEMSLVGPRPCLPNQYELIAERASRGVFALRPGITGLAQINGVDMSTPKLLAEIDANMLQNFGVRTYFSCIIKTISGLGYGDQIRRDSQ